MNSGNSCECWGCDLFGGGVCIPGLGCEPGLTDDESCRGKTEYCTSGTRDPESATCITPRALESACRYEHRRDLEKEGVCLQELGTLCCEENRWETCSACI